jgi:hypothetical protein
VSVALPSSFDYPAAARATDHSIGHTSTMRAYPPGRRLGIAVLGGLLFAPLANAQPPASAESMPSRTELRAAIAEFRALFPRVEALMTAPSLRWYGGWGSGSDGYVTTPSVARLWGATVFASPAHQFPQDEALAQLLGAIDAARRASPRDLWIHAMAVRYHALAGDYDEVAALAEACPAERWRCLMFAGFAQHLLKDFVIAERVFGDALAAMPEAEQCRWNDIGFMLDDDAAKRYAKLSCRDRAAFEARVWWLADPLYLRPGNDRRTEHLARHVALYLLEQDMGPLDTRVRESVIAMGVGLDQARVRSMRSDGRLMSAPSAQVRAGIYNPAPYPQLLYSFFPSNAAIASPMRIVPEDSVLIPVTQDRRVSSRRDSMTVTGNQTLTATYTLAYPILREQHFGPELAYIPIWDYQVSYLSRGDSALVLGAVDLGLDQRTKDGLPVSREMRAAMVMTRSEDDPPRVVAADSLSRRLRFMAIAPRDSALVSIEVVTARDASAGRVRLGTGLPVRPRAANGAPQRVSLSDLVMFTVREGAGPPTTFDAVRTAMLGTTHLTADGPLGIYWEIHGIASTDSAAITLAVRRGDARNGRTRIARTIPVDDASKTVKHTRWMQPDGPSEIASHALHLPLDKMPPGVYTLELSVRVPGQQTMTAAKRITVW